jgi:hypothetical protein
VATGGFPDEGQRVGDYVLRRRMGEGGMGVVFEADRLGPLRQKVAFKIIKPGKACPNSSRSWMSCSQADRDHTAATGKLPCC